MIDLPGTFDQISYDMLAQRVSEGYGFTVATFWWPATPAGQPTAHWSYLYTLYLAAVYSVVGYNPIVARLIQAVLAGALMPWLVHRIGRRHFGAPVGLATAALSAVYIYFVYYAATLMTETFYIIAILWTLDLAGQLGYVNREQNFTSHRSWLASGGQFFHLGLALAVTVLFRQVFLLFIPFLFAWLLWRSYIVSRRAVPSRINEGKALPVSSGRKARKKGHFSGILGGVSFQAGLQMMVGLIVATVILMAAIFPWTMRNQRAFDQFVLLNTNAGFAFFWGNHPIHGYNFISILPESGPSYLDLIPAELLDLNEAELDRALLKRGLAFIEADPARYLILSASRFKDYIKFWPSPESGLISNISRVFSFGLLLPLMLYGLWRSRLHRHQGTLLYLFVLIYTAVHLLSWALIRYRLPVDAVLLTFAGLAITEIWARVRRRQIETLTQRPPVSIHPGT